MIFCMFVMKKMANKSLQIKNCTFFLSATAGLPIIYNFFLWVGVKVLYFSSWQHLHVGIFVFSMCRYQTHLTSSVGLIFSHNKVDEQGGDLTSQ